MPPSTERLGSFLTRESTRMDSSRPGLELLPFELLMLIFDDLNGQDIRSVRLVNKEWELASRPSFALGHLSRSVFWLTSSGLNELEQLSSKFGPYMRTILIANDHFTISGFFRVFKRYWRDRRTVVKRSRYNKQLGRTIHTSYTILDIKSQHLAQYFKYHRWYDHGGERGIAPFFWRYFRNIVSQYWLRISGRDVSRLAAVMDGMPRCEAKVVSLSYEIGKLQTNARHYGKPAPKHAFELALLYAKEHEGADPAFSGHVEWVVEEAMDRRKLR